VDEIDTKLARTIVIYLNANRSTCGYLKPERSFRDDDGDSCLKTDDFIQSLNVSLQKLDSSIQFLVANPESGGIHPVCGWVASKWMISIIAGGETLATLRCRNRIGGEALASPPG
jgi:hypothetical protein